MNTRFHGSTRRIRLLLLVIFLGLAQGVAAENLPMLDEDPLLDDLLKELKQVTAIATRTKLNIDYVPGMVSVLHGHDLLESGLYTVHDALQTVPGIEITVSNEGQSHYLMRGIGKSFSSGKVKMLVNGRPQNATLSAASTASAIPVQMIDRIEIIRGPGSAIYGEYAFAGVINIVTRQDQQAYFFGSHLNRKGAGFAWANTNSNHPFKYAFNFSVSQQAGENVQAGNDFLKDISTGNTAVDDLFHNISNSPGTSNEFEQAFTSTLNMSYKNVKWDNIFLSQSMGDYFGIANTLPSNVTPIRQINTFASDLETTKNLSEHSSLKGGIGARAYFLRSKEHQFFPAGFPDTSTSNGSGYDNYFDSGVLGGPNYTDYEVRGNIELNYSRQESHEILLGVYASFAQQGNTWATRNHALLPDGNIQEIPLTEFRGSENWLTEGNTRTLVSLYAQDQWRVWKPFTFTFGGRIDYYAEIGSSINPRIAGVYNIQDRHVFKGQFSRAFRPPTFIEMFAQNNLVTSGNPNIEAETIESTEVGYIFNGALTRIRATTFYSVLDDLIILDSNGQYQNLESTKTEGAEFEFQQRFPGNITFNANATYLRVRDTLSDQPIPNIATVFGYADLHYKPVADTALSLNTQYIGPRKREAGDTREALSSYYLLNASLSLSNLLSRGLVLRIGVKNILDQAVYHPASLVSFFQQTLPAFASDYPRPGREIWANLSYEFD
ncbi:MAG: TonB-dependent receptor [Gammaproteobacteria bacterium]|nr:TonB-dependent receptor [Gammaproteobacteria bacterium]